MVKILGGGVSNIAWVMCPIQPSPRPTNRKHNNVTIVIERTDEWSDTARKLGNLLDRDNACRDCAATHPY